MRGTNSGVTIYSDIVSNVTVKKADIENSGVSVLDMSNCNRLREFVIGDSIRFAKGSSKSVAVIFPSVTEINPYGKLVFPAREIKLFGVSNVIFKSLRVEKCKFSVDGALSVESCNIVDCSCGAELCLRVIDSGRSGYDNIKVGVSDIEKLSIRADRYDDWRRKCFFLGECAGLREICIDVSVGGKAVWFGEFIDYIFASGLTKSFVCVSEITVKLYGGVYMIGDKEYLMKDIFPNLKRLTICGRKTAGDDRKLIVPEGCEIVYKE